MTQSCTTRNSMRNTQQNGYGLVYVTHFGHAGLLVEDGVERFLVDPGTLSHGFEGERDLSAVLITHQHADHLDAHRAADLLAENPNASLILDSESAEIHDKLTSPDRVRVVDEGDKLHFGDVEVSVIGRSHAVIHPDVPVVSNVGYFFESSGLFIPGDAFTAPDREVKTLALPISGPWQRLSDVVEYLRLVRPKVAVPVHEGMLAHPGIYVDYLRRLGPAETQIKVLEPNSAIEF